MKNSSDEIYSLLRDNIKDMIPYSTARDDCKIPMEIYLDANESPFENGVNRYPSPSQPEIKRKLARLKKVRPENIFIGNGSDEAIDLIFRLFCTPGKDSAVIVSPTYGMYGTAGRINDIKIIECPLGPEFSLDASRVLAAVDQTVKVIFLCSPNNPSGNLLEEKEIEKIIGTFPGITVIDQAYIDFAPGKSLCSRIDSHPRTIVLQTLSKAWGMAGLRIGMAIACETVIEAMNRIKYPYNISVPVQRQVLEMLDDPFSVQERVSIIISEREKMAQALARMRGVEKVFPSDANFLLVRFREKQKVFDYLKDHGIIVRDRSSLPLCRDCLRITIGTPRENDRLLAALENCADGHGSGEKREEEKTSAGRKATVKRKTKETDICVSVELDRFEEPFVSTGLHFFDHMLQQIGYHGAIGLGILCIGDLETDDHHTVEDTAIALGDALSQALGPKTGVERYGFALPMDEAQAWVLLDLGGRIDFKWEAEFRSEKIGDLNSQMLEHFFKTLAQHLKCNLHIRAEGKNDHHVAEGIFKAFARALKAAIRKDCTDFRIPSSKGIL